MQKVKVAFIQWMIRIVMRITDPIPTCDELAKNLYADIWPKHDFYALRNQTLIRSAINTAYIKGMNRER